MSGIAGVSIDRRDAYYEKLAAAKIITADPLGFYTRAEHGREIQAAIKPNDYETPEPVPAAPAPILDKTMGNILDFFAREAKLRG
jgi:hypothetical protein